MAEKTRQHQSRAVRQCSDAIEMNFSVSDFVNIHSLVPSVCLSARLSVRPSRSVNSRHKVIELLSMLLLTRTRLMLSCKGFVDKRTNSDSCRQLKTFHAYPYSIMHEFAIHYFPLLLWNKICTKYEGKLWYETQPCRKGRFLVHFVCTYVCSSVYSPLQPGMRPSQSGLRPSQRGLRPIYLRHNLLVLRGIKLSRLMDGQKDEHIDR